MCGRALLLAGALLAGCTCCMHGNRMSVPADPPNCRDIPGSSHSGQLCVTTTFRHGDVWFVRGSNASGSRQAIAGLSFTHEGQVSFGEFSISPGGSWLAVIIAEEGHPSLLFRRLPPLLHGEDQPDDLPVLAIYPGALGIVGWKDDDRLIIGSDQDLLHERHGGEAVLVLDYLVHLPDGAITLP